MPSSYALASDTSALPSATGWIEGVLLGNAATGLAVLAVAGLGLVAMQGRVPVGRGLRTLVGCFILFGAAAIAAGLMGLAHSVKRPIQAGAIAAPAPLPPLPSAPPSSPDPYAGASVPM